MNIVRKTALAALGAFVVPFSSVHAMCPICTVAVIGGLGLLERYGVDDLISGLWIGALIVSTTMWTISWFEKRGWRYPLYKTSLWLGYAAIVLIPLYMKGYIFSPERHSYFLGVDRLFFGIVAGSAIFFGAAWAYQRRKAKYGKALYPFQKVVQPVGAMVVATLIAYFITLN